jgi:quercetin dioxygenase-like cupin family protein
MGRVRDHSSAPRADYRLRIDSVARNVNTVLVAFAMSFLNVEQLPFVGMSHEFVGEKQGAPFSAYVVTAKLGQGPPLHTHPYTEVAFTIEGTATITVGDESAK